MANQRNDIDTRYSEVTGIPGTAVAVNFNAAGGASAASAALSANTMYVLVSTNNVRLAFAYGTPTASSSTMLWPAFVPFFFKSKYETTGTLKVAALSQDANTGSIVVTPLTGVVG